MQRFIELVTCWEATDVFLGKPIACIITMDSVGGTDVAGRLLTTMNQMGCSLPPFASVVLSRVALSALEANEQANQDVFRLDDFDVLVSNLLSAIENRRGPWKVWGIKAIECPDRHFNEPFPLGIDSENWAK